MMFTCRRPSQPRPAGLAHPHARALATMAVGASLLLACAAGRAAGGHHAVDDAAIADPGQCQVELWAEHSPQHHLQHLGPACNIAGAEVGINLDRNALSPSPTLRLRGVQSKWAWELRPGLSAGLAVGATWQSGGPPDRTYSLLLPMTWQPRDDLWLHLNLGRDFRHAATDLTRRGIAMEWQPHPQWQGLVEWFDDGLRLQRRAGLRYIPTSQLSIDLSRAQATTGQREAWWTLGLTWTWNR
jgi:hypothetical protein